MRNKFHEILNSVTASGFMFIVISNQALLNRMPAPDIRVLHMGNVRLIPELATTTANVKEDTLASVVKSKKVP